MRQKFVFKFSVEFLCVSDFFRWALHVCAGQSDFFPVFTTHTCAACLHGGLFGCVWGGRPFFVLGGL